MGMKCVRCGTDNDLRDRTTNQGRCKNCNHPFAFEPSAVKDYIFSFTDQFFAKVINDISAQNRLYFTPKQLFYLLDQRLNVRAYPSAGFVEGYGCFLIVPIIVLVIVGIQYVGLKDAIIVIVFLMPAILPLLGIIEIIIIIVTYNRKINPKYRRKFARVLQLLAGFILITGIILSLHINSFFWYLFTVIVGIISIYLGYRQLNWINNNGQSFFISESEFDGWINRWK